MDHERSVTFHRRATMALDAFSPQDRAKIADAVRLLEDTGNARALQSRTAKLSIPEPMYVMRATPTIRLIYSMTPNAIEILDVVKRATLNAFLKKTDKKAATKPSEGSAASAKPVKKSKPAKRA
jgi:mRNA-degrading endonuclease RelE of RelBE toxin-antitoxin system